MKCTLANRHLLVLFLVSAMLPLVAQQAQEKSAPSANFSGMYSFTQEGEFVQITVDGQNNVTGFVSRYGDRDSDRGAFLDQFFKKASTDGTTLKFTTDTVHGTWYEFDGTVKRGEGKTPDDEAYYVITGKLSRFNEDAHKHVTSEARTVTMKSFPQDADEVHQSRN